MLARDVASTRERLAAAAADEMVAATDVADLLVRRGMPFREAHGVVGVAGPRPRSSAASRSRELSEDELKGHSELLDDEFYEVLASRLVARVEGLRGRHVVGAGRRAARAPRGAAHSPRSRAGRGDVDAALGADFFDRSSTTSPAS